MSDLFYTVLGTTIVCGLVFFVIAEFNIRFYKRKLKRLKNEFDAMEKSRDYYRRISNQDLRISSEYLDKILELQAKNEELQRFKEMYEAIKKPDLVIKDGALFCKGNITAFSLNDLKDE